MLRKTKKVVGVISDGDVRRAMLRGVTFLAPVKSIMNMNFVFSNTNDLKKVKEIMLEKKVNTVPILNENQEIVDIVFIDELQNNL